MKDVAMKDMIDEVRVLRSRIEALEKDAVNARKEAIEDCAELLSKQDTWITNIAAATLVLNIDTTIQSEKEVEEFKIGDNVVVLADSEGSGYYHCFEAGDIGVVRSVDTDPGSLSIEVVVNGKSQWLNPSELEKVNEHLQVTNEEYDKALFKLERENAALWEEVVRNVLENEYFKKDAMQSNKEENNT